MKFNAAIRILSLLVFVIFICSCEDDKEPAGNNLKNPQILIASIISPDRIESDGPTEVFVGNAISHELPYYPKKGKDEVLNEYLVKVRDYLYWEITGTGGANVEILDENNQIIKFEDVGRGFYRLADSNFKFAYNTKYTLSVKVNGEEYTATTKTLSPIEFDLESDTLQLKYMNKKDIVGNYFSMKSVPNATYYHSILHYSNNLSVNLHHYTFSKDSVIIFASNTSIIYPYLVDFAADISVIAVDSSLGLKKLGCNGNDYIAQTQFDNWIESNVEKKYNSTSQIHGTKKANGVFGSFVMTKRRLYAKKPAT